MKLTPDDLESLAEPLMAEEDRRLMRLLGAPDGHDAVSGEVFDLKTAGKYHVFRIEPSRVFGVSCEGPGCLFCAAGNVAEPTLAESKPLAFSDEFKKSFKKQIEKLLDATPLPPKEKPMNRMMVGPIGLFGMATAFGVDVPREMDRLFGKVDHRDPEVERKPGAKADARAKRAKRAAKRRKA